MQVLPGKENRTDAVAHRVATGDGRGQVVGLFVDVEHVRPEPTNDLAKPSEPEEVVAPVQSQRRVGNLVAARRRTLGNLRPALFHPAIGRNRQQVQVGVGP